MNDHLILIVENDSDDRLLILEAFRTIGRADQIDFFSSGPDLLQHLSSLPSAQQPSLIVLDYNMPGLNGLQTLLQIRKHPNHQEVPVVVFSSGFTPHIQQELQTHGAIACLQKGQNFKRLVEQVRFFSELILDEVDWLVGNC